MRSLVAAMNHPTPSETSPLLGAANGAATPESVPTSPALSHRSDPGDQDSLSVPSRDEEAGVEEYVRKGYSKAAVSQSVLVLLIAVFVFNADSLLVLATYPTIGSEFDALESASWLSTGFWLGGAAAQNVFTRLSEIYGRKSIILICYFLFAIGSLVVGLGQSMAVVILGRVICGSAGAGMTVLVSMLITDIVPIRDVAPWRAYVNVAATTGRSLGGPLGGWLADMIGWRWSFIGQAPLIVVAFVLCAIFLPSTHPKAEEQEQQSSKRSTISRLDIPGTTILALLILCFLLPMELGGTRIPWTHPLILILLIVAGLLLVLFLTVEKWWASEPIIPLQLFSKWDTMATMLVILLQIGAQVGMMYSAPLYFQITSRASNTEAGAHLFPSVAGNAVGGILSGVLIKRTGKYKWLVILAMLSSSLGYGSMMLRWQGDTNWLESLLIIPGGFGTGICVSALFVSMQATVAAKHMGPAISTFYLFNSIGGAVGLAVIAAATQQVLHRQLDGRLLGLGLDAADRERIVAGAAASVHYVYQTTGPVEKAIVASYVEALSVSNGMSLGLAALGLVFACSIGEHPL